MFDKRPIFPRHLMYEVIFTNLTFLAPIVVLIYKKQYKHCMWEIHTLLQIVIVSSFHHWCMTGIRIDGGTYCVAPSDTLTFIDTVYSYYVIIAAITPHLYHWSLAGEWNVIARLATIVLILLYPDSWHVTIAICGACALTFALVNRTMLCTMRPKNLWLIAALGHAALGYWVKTQHIDDNNYYIYAPYHSSWHGLSAAAVTFSYCAL